MMELVFMFASLNIRFAQHNTLDFEEASVDNDSMPLKDILSKLNIIGSSNEQLYDDIVMMGSEFLNVPVVLLNIFETIRSIKR